MGRLAGVYRRQAVLVRTQNNSLALMCPKNNTNNLCHLARPSMPPSDF